MGVSEKTGNVLEFDRRGSESEGRWGNARPASGNALPDHAHTAADPVQFRKLLKSDYFSRKFLSFVDSVTVRAGERR